MQLDHWPFIIASYVIAIGGTVGLSLWSLIAMRRAEREAEQLKRDRS